MLVTEIEITGTHETLLLFGRNQGRNHHLQILSDKRLPLLDKTQIAVHAHDRRHADNQVQVRSTGFDRST